MSTSPIHSKTRQIEQINVAFLSGGSGAVPSSFIRARGVTSIARKAAGVYEVLFDRGFSDAVSFDGSVVQAAVIAGAYSDFDPTKACVVQFLKSDNANRKITFVCFTLNRGSNLGPAALDPASGDVVRFSIGLKRSTGLA